ncbi:MAG TPA: glycosyltransferase family 2 protein [Bryobacteraceae bacterium]|jgi:cellulose synthase/poly-beta-1,6-N-acetylglucosamine synthase-like glycosyltransferase|nr:glycosyltransferase family 2 protein [Bryobacteraceae bacterium]
MIHPMIQPIFTAVLGALAAFLFVVSLASFFALLRGSFYLRRFARAQIRDDRAMLLKSPLVPAVSLIATVSDATPASKEFVRHLLEVHYGKHELVLVLDGLGEADLDVWKQEFHLAASRRPADELLPSAQIRRIYEPRDPLRLVVVDKESGGDDDSRNAAVNVADSPLIGIVERDAEFQPDAFLQLVRCMLEDPDKIVAVCGTAPAPHNDNLASRFGALESYRQWLGRCGSLVERNMLSAVPGCAMLVRRDILITAGGFRAGNLDMFLRLHRAAKASGKPYRIALAPEPVSHVRTPSTVSELRASAMADQSEIAGALRSQSFRTPGLPSLFTIRLLRPVLETVAYVLAIVGLATRWIQPEMAGLVALATIGMGILLSMAAVVFREQARLEGAEPRKLRQLFFAAFPENLGYRQRRNLWLIGGLRKRNRRPVAATAA